jgi:hypothetical protein
MGCYKAVCIWQQEHDCCDSKIKQVCAQLENRNQVPACVDQVGPLVLPQDVNIGLFEAHIRGGHPMAALGAGGTRQVAALPASLHAHAATAAVSDRLSSPLPVITSVFRTHHAPSSESGRVVCGARTLACQLCCMTLLSSRDGLGCDSCWQ